MKEIVVVEILRAQPGKASKLKEALYELVPHCRKEEGCLQYDLLGPVQGDEEFLVLMRWRTLEDLARHESSKHIADFVEKHNNLYSDVTQTEWKALNRSI